MALTVLRTAAGSSVAPSIIKEFKKHGHKVIAADINPLSCGFEFADEGVVVPRVTAPDYIDHLLQICTRFEVDVFIPDLDEELLLVSESKAKFDAINVKVIISDPATLNICVNKYRTFEFFRTNDILVPDTELLKKGEKPSFSYPFLIKPVHGRGSQGVHIVNDDYEFDFYTRGNKNYVAQEILPGTELTIDTLSDMDGNFLYASVRERLEVDSGISSKGRTINNQEVVENVKKACNLLKIKGPGCFQAFYDKGRLCGFIEINPRIAGTTILSIKAGAPIIEDILNVATGSPVVGLKNYKYNVVMLRYWSDVIKEL